MFLRLVYLHTYDRELEWLLIKKIDINHAKPAKTL